MMKWVKNADLLEKRLLAQQDNISKRAIYRTGPWVNTQILKMTPDRTPVQIHTEMHRMAVWFEAWAGSQEFPVSLFPSSVCLLIPTAPSLCWHTGNDTEEVMIHRQIVHSSFCQPAVPEAPGVLVAGCTLFTAGAMSCFGHMPPVQLAFQSVQPLNITTVPCSMLFCPVLKVNVLPNKDECQNLKY